MFQPIYEYAHLAGASGRRYRPRAYGELQVDGRWAGWLVFFPIGGGEVVATDRQTTQSTLVALGDWAAGVTRVYLEGALGRALDLAHEPDFAMRLSELARLELLHEQRS
jgi:hypothetical protein